MLSFEPHPAWSKRAPRRIDLRQRPSFKPAMIRESERCSYSVQSVALLMRSNELGHVAGDIVWDDSLNGVRTPESPALSGGE